MRNGNLIKFIEKAHEIHNKKYDYTKVIENEPNSVKDYILVTCPIHGDFKTTFDSHVNKKCGCPTCNRGKRRTTEEFIVECKNVHKNKKYDYSKTVFTKVSEKVTVICHEKNILGKEHGEFSIRPDHLLKGHGCPYCAKRYLTTEEVVLNAKHIHGDKYDYSLIEYHNDNSERLPIVCHVKDDDGNEHGIFTPIWSSHINGVGCPKCNGGVKQTKEDFVKKARKIHGEKYGYDDFEYVNATTPGKILCYRHGHFMQTPYAHAKMGQGCPRCKSSKIENLLINVFIKNNIEYEHQIVIEELNRQSFDFFIPNKGLYIECQGEQHYVPTKFSTSMTDEAVNKAFETIKRHDADKYDYVSNNGYKIIYFTNPFDYRTEGVCNKCDFYKDKIVFEKTDDVIRYIKSLDNITDSNSVIDNFRKDIKKITNDIICNGRRFIYRNYVIYLNSLEGNTRTSINDNRRRKINKGYKVINIFEDEYINHKDIVLSKLKHIFGLYDKKVKRIPGRKCLITEIDNKLANDFLTKNHIQGSVGSTVYFGAKYEDRLVAVMTFTQEIEGYWNLTRFASDNSYICQGVGGKLFRHFIKKYNPYEVKSFADRRWTTDETGNLYTKLGFTLDSVLNSEYRYYKIGVSKEREHKFGFRKQILHKKYGLPLSMTESEMTEALGYVKIWDCGLFKYVWRNEDKLAVESESVEI